MTGLMYSAVKERSFTVLMPHKKRTACKFHILWQRRTIIAASHLCINLTNSVTSIRFYCSLSLSLWARCIVCTSIPFFSNRPASCWFESWGSLTTTMAAIPPTQERMAWHLPELQGGNTFFWNGTAGIYKAERTHAGPHWDSFILAC